MRKNFYSTLSSDSQSVFLARPFSKYQPSHSQCRIPFLQPILPWLSFRIQSEEHCWKMCGFCWLPHFMQIDNHRDASWGLEAAKNHTGQNLVSTMDEVTVQNWCFQDVLAPVVQYGDAHYPGTRFTSSSLLRISD